MTVHNFDSETNAMSQKITTRKYNVEDARALADIDYHTIKLWTVKRCDTIIGSSASQ